MAIRKIICKKLMKIFPAYPDKRDPHLWEIFNTKEYLKGSKDYQKELRYSSSKASYLWEKDQKKSWIRNYFFPRIKEQELCGKTLLDLGSFTGGRVIAWTEKYKLERGYGLDINPIFKVASDEFAESLNIKNTIFKTGFGENLPFDDESLDFIISTDVFEHVKDLELVLEECYRVLKKGGKLCVVFPQYFQPLEAHLGMVTNMQALHWIFPSEIIASAYNEIIEERAPDSYWYKPVSFPLSSWEKLFSLNGTSIKGFNKLIHNQKWLSKDFIVKPIFTDGTKSNWLIFKFLSKIVFPLAHLPFLNELFLGRVNCILVK